MELPDSPDLTALFWLVEEMESGALAHAVQKLAQVGYGKEADWFAAATGIAFEVSLLTSAATA